MRECEVEQNVRYRKDERMHGMDSSAVIWGGSGAIWAELGRLACSCSASRRTTMLASTSECLMRSSARRASIPSRASFTWPALQLG